MKQDAVLSLPGCRHDILGHYLKAIGILRVLAKCAAPKHLDPDAEGWWDPNDAIFYLSSPKYPTRELLAEFFEKHYEPTPVFVTQHEDGTAPTRSTSISLTDFLLKAALEAGANTEGLETAHEAISSYRDAPRMELPEIIDSISTPRFSSGADNPLWLSKGRTSGVGHIWSSFGEYVDGFEKIRRTLIRSRQDLKEHIGSAKVCIKLERKIDIAQKKLVKLLPFSVESEGTTSAKGKGTPFFPDAIKSYNIGNSWVEEKYPFSAMDYILAVEGAFAMRGGAGRALGANSKRFAAFPFVFDSGEDMVDDSNEVKGTSSALWFPLWNRKTTFNELVSYITDAQARLPGKEARFSAEFVRALNSHGVDAGFSGWQEFRFKMKGSRVPWITTGRFLAASQNKAAIQLNRALNPLDESRFMDQFEIAWKGNKADSRSPHPIRAEINAAMEGAALDPTAPQCMAFLEAIFKASRQLAISKSFRSKVQGSGTFFDPLPMAEWRELLRDMEDRAELRIARAIASILGLQFQHSSQSYSKVQPMLGSLLPVSLKYGRWQLEESSKQSVWTGTDLCHDLTSVFQRRYMDSLKDDQPALRSVHQARLEDVMAFLNGELDDHLIARWIESLSLVGWHFEKPEVIARKETDEALAASDAAPLDLADQEFPPPAIPLAYAALRTLLELECEWQGADQSSWKKRRSQQPISHLCQRSANSLPMAVSEALRWIGIWGVRNPWGAKSRQEKEILSGRYIVRLDHTQLTFSENLVDPSRLAAAVCIPLAWKDQWQLRRVITLPFSA